MTRVQEPIEPLLTLDRAVVVFGAGSGVDQLVVHPGERITPRVVLLLAWPQRSS